MNIIVPKTMYRKLNRGYVAPETSIISVTLESGICGASKSQVVFNDENATVNIDSQDAGGDFTLNDWSE